MTPEEIMEISENIREELNHQAYMDVLDGREPTQKFNDYYMHCYRFWNSISPFYPSDEDCF